MESEHELSNIPGLNYEKEVNQGNELLPRFRKRATLARPTKISLFKVRFFKIFPVQAPPFRLSSLPDTLLHPLFLNFLYQFFLRRSQ